MREILFRGKRKDNGEWIEGIPIKTYDTEIGINLPLRYKPKNITLMNNDRVLLCCAMDDSAYFDTEDYPIIDDETVGQYTGLKDRNNVKVFEGDIVACSQSGSYGISVIVYDNSAFYVMPLNGNILERTLWDYWYNDWDIEVIGNVFDNSLEELQNGD